MTDMERLCKALNKAEWETGARAIGGNMPKGERDVLIIRAVLRELREPTQDMVAAYTGVIGGEPTPNRIANHSQKCRKRWQAMIDTILQEAE